MDADFLPLQDALAGEYSFERELGRGGMGVVYLARDVQLDRPVAIKVLPADLAAREDVRARFLREARTAAGLSHPNIVPIHRVGEAAGIPFFVMTFIDGATLGERLRERGPVSPSTIAQILRDVAQALGYAHSRGIVHRDIKPDNVLLDTATGRAMVSDFGIAADIGERREGPIPGTVGFISPEQLEGLPADGRSDLYSLGVVAHLALTGSLPEHETAAVVSTSDTTPSLAAAISRCLSRDPAARFADAEALVTALDPPRAIARTNLPPELRTWASEPVPLLPLYTFLSFGGFGSAIYAVAQGYSAIVGTTGGIRFHVNGITFLGMGMWILPLLPMVLHQFRKTKVALHAGYRLTDLRFALRTWREERLAQIERNAASEKAWVRVASWIPILSAGISLAGTAIVALMRPEPSFIVTSVIRGQLFLFVSVATLGLLAPLGLPLLPASLHREMIGRLRGWLWNSKVGQWLADRLAPKTGGVPLAAFRPTEMALEVAIDDLFAGLPDEYRESLRDLPAVARRLAARATALRAAMDQMAGGDVAGDSSPRKTLNASTARLTETVTALERLRLGLIRLHGGLVDLRPVTTALDAARAIDSDMERLVDAQAEVSGGRSLLGFERRSPSPA